MTPTQTGSLPKWKRLGLAARSTNLQRPLKSITPSIEIGYVETWKGSLRLPTQKEIARLLAWREFFRPLSTQRPLESMSQSSILIVLEQQKSCLNRLLPSLSQRVKRLQVSALISLRRIAGSPSDALPGEIK